MKLFSTLYAKVKKWAAHPHASFYLAGLSISEAIFFPIPPDVMLAPMSLSKPERAWRYAGLTTMTSTLGGLLGYWVGMFFMLSLMPLVQHFGYEQTYLQVQQGFVTWGAWIMLLAAFTPIPYKLFTLTAGASAMPLLPFLLAALVGRALRFYLISALMKWGGESMERVLLRYIEWLGWILVGLFVVYLFVKLT